MFRVKTRRHASVMLVVIVVLASMFLLRLGTSSSGVYWAQTDLAFVSPNMYNFGNGLRSEVESPTFFAAAVERQYSGRPVTSRPAGSDATLYGLGVREGVSVSLLDAGGQWRDSFDRPLLRVQATGPHPDGVRASLASTVSRLVQIATERQLTAGVAPAHMITVVPVQTTPRVIHVSGNRPRALVAAALLAAALAIGARRALRYRQLTTV